MTPDEEIIYLQGVKQYIDSRIQSIKQKQKNSKRPKVGHKLSYSGLFIQADCMIPYIEDAIKNGDSTTAIAERAVVSGTTVSNILIRKYQWMREEVADSILTALGLPHVFNDIPKVRIKRKVSVVNPVPESQYFEE